MNEQTHQQPRAFLMLWTTCILSQLDVVTPICDGTSTAAKHAAASVTLACFAAEQLNNMCKEFVSRAEVMLSDCQYVMSKVTPMHHAYTKLAAAIVAKNNFRSLVSIQGPEGYGPSTLPLRHSECIILIAVIKLISPGQFLSSCLQGLPSSRHR